MHAWNLIKRWTKYCWYNFEIEFNTASNCTFAVTSSSLKVKPLVILDLGWKLWVYKKTLLSSLFLLCIFPLTFWNVSYWYTVHKLCIKVKQIPKSTIWRRRKNDWLSIVLLILIQTLLSSFSPWSELELFGQFEELADWEVSVEQPIWSCAEAFQGSTRIRLERARTDNCLSFNISEDKIQIQKYSQIQTKIQIHTILEDGEDGKDGWYRLRHSCAAPALASMWVACNLSHQTGLKCIKIKMAQNISDETGRKCLR